MHVLEHVFAPESEKGRGRKGEKGRHCTKFVQKRKGEEGVVEEEGEEEAEEEGWW